MIKIVMTEDKSHAAFILEGLKRNEGHCPCILEKTPDTKCRCKEFREMEAPCTCLCGLFKKVVIEEDKN